MALFTPDQIGVPDRNSGTSLTVGDRGKPTNQDEQGKQVTRTGGSSKQVDFDIYDDGAIDLTNGDWDSVNNTSLDDPSNIGGTTEVSAAFTSLDSNAFEFVVQWIECETCSEVMYEETFSTGGDDLRANVVTVKSDIVRYKLRDTSSSSQNRVRGTINAH